MGKLDEHLPWTSEVTADDENEVVDARGVHVALVPAARHAQLMAAAPDLLEACDLLVNAFDDRTELVARQKALAALSAARGAEGAGT